MEVTHSHYLILEGAARHLHHTPLVRNRSVGPAHIQEEGVTQRGEHQVDNSVAADHTDYDG